MQARQFLRQSEHALVIYTTGPWLHIDPETHEGSTGNWDIDPQRPREGQRIILYLRTADVQYNELYIATIRAVEPSEDAGRYRITFEHAQYIGTTAADWQTFAETGSNPVRYIA